VLGWIAKWCFAYVSSPAVSIRGVLPETRAQKAQRWFENEIIVFIPKHGQDFSSIPPIILVSSVLSMYTSVSSVSLVPFRRP
jgi:hypothetical protein